MRRLSAYEQSERLFGTDVSIEGLVARDGSEFDIIAADATELDGDLVHKIVARPTYGSSYDRGTFFIAESDHAILRAEYHLKGRELPFEVIFSPEIQNEFFTTGNLELRSKLLFLD